ncbi:MAG TPA: amidohydrolase family protein [Opitutaceae bacterium]|nr:amidohydrolase family protein [Opitutaceae bacterium]
MNIPEPSRPRRIDMHVHLVGNGSAGTGCWYEPTGLTRLLQPVMLRAMGLPAAALSGDFDRIYRDRLVELVRGSSLDAAVLLAHDRVYRDDGAAWEGRGTFHVPNDYVLALAREHACFLPAVSIHPGRPDALDELERCLAAGAVALKLLPNCHNVDCARPAYAPFWARMAEAGLPLIAHTGCESTVDEARPDLAHPHNLLAPLRAGVKVIAAHCGTGKPGLGREWFHVWRAMLRDHPNLYGDISALSIPGRDRFLPLCRHAGVAERVLHGSDVPVPVFAWPALARKRIRFRQYLALRRERNPLERDYALKRMMGFDDRMFATAERVLRLARPEQTAARSA